MKQKQLEEKIETLEMVIESTCVAIGNIKENVRFYGAPHAEEDLEELREKLKEVLECLKQEN